MYSPDKYHKAFRYALWWSDAWNPIDYGRDFDFSRSFFEQFLELSVEVPHAATEVNMIENSDYSNCV